MSSQLYKEFLNLFKQWPLDATKRGRDLGELLRKRFSVAFQQGESSSNVDLKYWTKAHADLKRLVNNEFATKYPRANTSGGGALGLSKEQCKVVLSNAAMEQLGQSKDLKKIN